MSAELQQDTVFDVLSSPRRRYTLYYLRTHGEVDILDLAAAVAAWEYETDVDSITDQQRKRVYVSLYQTHVPKLDDLGLVDYDKDSGTVAITDRAKELDRYLTADQEDTFTWQYLYLVVAAVGGLILAGAMLDWPVLGVVPDVVAALLLVGTFLVVSIGHYLYQSRLRSRLPPELQYGDNRG